MRIPTVDQSVGTDAPLIPTIQSPRVVPQAFGAEVSESVQKLGNAGVQASDALSRHIYQENIWRGQATIADRSLRLRGNFQDLATSTDPITTFKPGSTPSNTAPFASPTTDQEGMIGQPKGYLNRQGFNAMGSTAQFASEANPMREQFLAEFKSNPQLYKTASLKFNEVYASYYDQVSKHEATQYRLGMNNTFNAQTVSTITSTASSNNPDNLLAGIEMIKSATTQQYQYKGAEQDQIDNQVKKNVADAVSKAVVNKLTSTGDIKQAQAMLDAAKDSIDPERYEKIDSMLDTGFTRLQQQAHVATVQKQISGQANLLTDFSTGKAGWMNLDDVTNLVNNGIISEKFGKAYSDVIASKGNYQPRQANNENVPKFIDAIYNAKDQTQVHDTLIRMMQEHKNMSQDEMAVLINSALKRSGTLPLNLKISPNGTPDPKQNNIDAGARQVVNFGRRNSLSPDDISFMYGAYYNKASKGMAVNQAIQEATRQYAINKYPQVAAMEEMPTAVISDNSQVKYLHFNPNVTVAPSRVWNPKTGTFDVNTNRAKTSGGEKKQ